jgi:hypothetical protein
MIFKCVFTGLVDALMNFAPCSGLFLCTAAGVGFLSTQSVDCIEGFIGQFWHAAEYIKPKIVLVYAFLEGDPVRQEVGAFLKNSVAVHWALRSPFVEAFIGFRLGVNAISSFHEITAVLPATFSGYRCSIKGWEFLGCSAKGDCGPNNQRPDHSFHSGCSFGGFLSNLMAKGDRSLALSGLSKKGSGGAVGWLCFGQSFRGGNERA